MIIYRDEDYLEHHGVDGQKWGRRRYQNEDGSYKPGAEGRYDSDGEPGPNVSKNRSKVGKTEHDSFKDAKKRANKKKSEGEEEDEEISKRADVFQKKNPKMSRRDAESAAEDEMIKEAREKKQRENDKKAAHDSYKKVIGRNFLRSAGVLAGSTAIGYGYGKLTGNLDAGAKVGRAVNIAGSLANNINSVVEAKRIHDYRKRKNAKHSDYSDCEIYHGSLGNDFAIFRS